MNFIGGTMTTDLAGKKIGMLNVLRRGEGKIIGKKKIKRTTWVCLCKKCNKEVEMLTSNLTRKIKSIKTCQQCSFQLGPKYNFKDLVGEKFGLLTVESMSGKKTKTRGIVWRCKCDCGAVKEVATNGLTSGNYLCCGGDVHFTSPRIIGDIPLDYLNGIRQNAIKRNFKYEVSPEYLWELFLNQDKKCALTGVEIEFTKKKNSHKTKKETTASLDRIDSDKGYMEGNVQWLHKVVNIMKRNHSEKDFLEWNRKIFLNTHQKIDARPSFDEYFLMLAFDVRLRSDDKFNKHGAIIVDNFSKHIVGTGYNGTISGSTLDTINYYDREYRRKFMIHAEENAILNCWKNPLESKEGATIYVTGEPCVNCLQRIVNFGITKIVCADREGTITESDDTEKIRDKIFSISGIEIEKISLTNFWIKKTFYG